MDIHDLLVQPAIFHGALCQTCYLNALHASQQTLLFPTSRTVFMRLDRDNLRYEDICWNCLRNEHRQRCTHPRCPLCRLTVNDNVIQRRARLLRLTSVLCVGILMVLLAVRALAARFIFSKMGLSPALAKFMATLYLLYSLACIHLFLPRMRRLARMALRWINRR